MLVSTLPVNRLLFGVHAVTDPEARNVLTSLLDAVDEHAEALRQAEELIEELAARLSEAERARCEIEEQRVLDRLDDLETRLFGGGS